MPVMIMHWAVYFSLNKKIGNANKFQGNARLSATESAITLEGPLSNNKKTTFLASATKSYFQCQLEKKFEY